MSLHDYVGLAVVIGIVVVVYKLIFGGNASSGAGSHNKKGMHSLAAEKGKAGGSRGESSAQQAWRESRETREQALRRRKQEMVEAARRRFLEQDQGAGGADANSSSSSSAASAGQHAFAMPIASGSGTHS